MDYLIYLFTETGLIVDLILVLTGIAVYLIFKESNH